MGRERLHILDVNYKWKEKEHTRIQIDAEKLERIKNTDEDID